MFRFETERVEYPETIWIRAYLSMLYLLLISMHFKHHYLFRFRKRISHAFFTRYVYIYFIYFLVILIPYLYRFDNG